MPETNREKDLFESALDLPSAEEQVAFLERACQGDAVLLKRLLALLAAEQANSSFLPGEPGDRSSPQEEVETTVGPYKILEQIGEGGFGVVYMAEQTQPIRRRVALKIIKPGMDSKQVIARFEAERQALAMMNHPNIAQVFEAGSTEQGRPYFVMELVHGIPITKFCEEQGLDIEARLKLFGAVCDAVQHAHQKGIIHRDLKPTNILVSLHGERHVPKVIDFGIAKATQQPLTEKTLFTNFQHFLGTPAYMSPEQAALSGLDIDTRSDIYSLGVLLYELLTGTPPFDPKELLSAGIDSMRRTICEKEPERPSTRLRRTAQSGSSVPAPPLGRLAHDLDLIVLKALAKDRDRRYATANGLAADLQRYINHEQVTAVAPTLGYQLTQFYRRNRPVVLIGAAFAISLLGAAIVATGLAIKARRAQAIAINEAVTSYNVSEFYWKEIFMRLTPWEHTNRNITLREAFEIALQAVPGRLESQPLAEASVRLAYGKAYTGLSELAAADTNLQRALELRRRHAGPKDVRTAEVLFSLATLRAFQNRMAEAEALYEETAAIRAVALGPDAPDTVQAEAQAAFRKADRLPPADAEKLLLRTIDRSRRFGHAEGHPTRALMNRLGDLYLERQEYDKAYDLYNQTYQMATARDGATSSGALWGLDLMMLARARQGRFAEAEKMALDLIAVREQVSGPDHFFTLGIYLSYNDRILVPQERFEEAARILMQTAAKVRASRPQLEATLRANIQLLLDTWRTNGGGPQFEEFRRQASAYLSPGGVTPQP